MAAPGTLPATLILREPAPTHGTVSTRSSDRSVNRPELDINRVQSHESNRSSMSAESRTFRVLVVAPGADPAVVLDAVTAIAASDDRHPAGQIEIIRHVVFLPDRCWGGSLEQQSEKFESYPVRSAHPLLDDVVHNNGDDAGKSGRCHLNCQMHRHHNLNCATVRER